MIVVNARFLTQEITGVQRYSMEICRELKKQDPSIIFVCSKDILHKESAKELGAVQFGNMSGHLWEQIELPKYLDTKNTPLLLNLGNTAPLFYKKKISTIHDIAFEKFPNNFSWKFRSFYKFLIPRIISSSQKIFTVSEFSKNEICKLYKTPTSKVEVIHNASSSIFTPKANTALQEKYIFAASSLTQQKNFAGLIDAFSTLKDKDHLLLLAGSINRNFASQSLINKIDSNPRIKFLGRVSDSKLVELYSNAKAFIHPSFYEGFGIPPLEAQACGCPVVCSNIASLPEVCGNSALYFDPYDTADIANKIDSILIDPNLSERLVLRGYENIKRFNWHNSATKLLASIKELQ